MTYQQKLEKLMKHIHNSGLWVNTHADIILGDYVEMTADTNKKINMAFPREQNYCSSMVYTILSSLQKPKGSLLYTGGCGNGKTSLAQFIGHFLFSDIKISYREYVKEGFKNKRESLMEKLVAVSKIPEEICKDTPEVKELVNEYIRDLVNEYKEIKEANSKEKLAEKYANLDEIKRAKIQCHPEQTEEKMVARLNTGKLVKHGLEDVMARSFIDCPVHILDEVNRLPPDKEDILYGMLDTGEVKYMDELLVLADGPIFGTRNYNDEGNFPMAPPFLDRWELSVKVPAPNAQDLEFITNEEDSREALRERLNIPEELKLTAEDREKIWQEIKKMPFTKDARNFIHYFASQVNFCMNAASPSYNACAPAFMNKGSCERKKPDAICKDCHYHTTRGDSICKLTKNEVSVRSIKATYKYARALAWLAGRKEVDVEIVKNVLPYTVGHKLEQTRAVASEHPNENFENDSAAFVRMLVKKTDKFFGEAREIFKSWGSIVNAYEKVIKGEMKPEDLVDKVTVHGMAEMAQFDDPVKYSIACWLQRIYHFAVNKYDLGKK